MARQQIALGLGVLLLAGCGAASTVLGEAATPPSDLSDEQRLALARRRLPGCRFVHGFAEVRALAPDLVGDCVENERGDPATGNTLQRTSRGLLVWRRADGLVAFTDGHRTWVRGPDGHLRDRLNDERFTWEAAPAEPDAPPVRLVTPGPPATPAPAATGSPAPGDATPPPRAAATASR